MPTPNVIRMLSAGYKHGKVAQEQLARRAAIRQALSEAAFRLMVGLQASPAVQERFRRNVVDLMRTAGSKPSGPLSKVKSWFRGGPATVFDGPEARNWKRQVRYLGVEAFRLLRKQDGSVAVWKGSDADFGEEYLSEVMAYLDDQAERGGRAPELAIIAEQDRAEDEEDRERRRTPTRLRVTKIVLAVAVGFAVGQGVDKAVATPDWVDAAIVAVAGGAAAGASISPKKKSAAPISAEIPSFLDYVRLNLQTSLQEIVSTFTSICDRGRDPPGLDVGPLSEQIAGSLRRLSAVACCGEVRLRISDEQRSDLALAAKVLARDVKVLSLARIDPDAARSAEKLIAMVNAMIGGKIPKEYEFQVELGRTFVQALFEALNLAARLERLPSAERPEDPGETVRIVA